MDTEQAVEYLKKHGVDITEKQLRDMALRGEVEAWKIGGRWNYTAHALEYWLMTSGGIDGDLNLRCIIFIAVCVLGLFGFAVFGGA